MHDTAVSSSVAIFNGFAILVGVDVLPKQFWSTAKAPKACDSGV